MKNWLMFNYGSWRNGKTWQEEGVVYIDPTAVTAVQSTSKLFPQSVGSIISTPNDHFTVRELPQEIIALIQSTLPE